MSSLLDIDKCCAVLIKHNSVIGGKQKCSATGNNHPMSYVISQKDNVTLTSPDIPEMDISNKEVFVLDSLGTLA